MTSPRIRRFHLPEGRLSRSPITLDGPEGRHLAKVLRGRPGQVVSLYDEEGRTHAATVLSVNRRRGEVRLAVAMQASGSRPMPHLELGVGFLKGAKLDEIIRFSASLGVHRIHPFLSSRSVATETRPWGSEKVARWQRIAVEACKISPGTIPPPVSPPDTLARVVERLSAARTRIILWEGSAPPVTEVLRTGGVGEGLALLVGPEGGFSDHDLRCAELAGFRPASLGPIVLRSEYAVQTAVILVLHAAGRFGEPFASPRGVGLSSDSRKDGNE